MWDWSESKRSYDTSLRQEEEKAKLMTLRYEFKIGPPSNDKLQLISEWQDKENIQAIMFNPETHSLEMYHYTVDDWLVSRGSSGE